MHPQIKICSVLPGELYTKRCWKAAAGAYTAFLRGNRCKTEDDFFWEISAAFQFPDYYGENWPATDECLCDLEWLCPKEVFVVVDHFSQMFSSQPEHQKQLQDRVVRYFGVMIDYWAEENVPVEVWLNQ